MALSVHSWHSIRLSALEGVPAGAPGSPPGAASLGAAAAGREGAAGLRAGAGAGSSPPALCSWQPPPPPPTQKFNLRFMERLGILALGHLILSFFIGRNLCYQVTLIRFPWHDGRVFALPSSQKGDEISHHIVALGLGRLVTTGTPGL